MRSKMSNGACMRVTIFTAALKFNRCMYDNRILLTVTYNTKRFYDGLIFNWIPFIVFFVFYPPPIFYSFPSRTLGK